MVKQYTPWHLPRQRRYPMRPFIRRGVIGERGPELIRLRFDPRVVVTSYKAERKAKRD